MMAHHLKNLLEKSESLDHCIVLLGDILTLLRSNDVVRERGVPCANDCHAYVMTLGHFFTAAF